MPAARTVLAAVLLTGCVAPKAAAPELAYPEQAGEPQLRFCVQRAHAAKDVPAEELRRQVGAKAPFESLAVIERAQSAEACDLIIVLVGDPGHEYAAAVSAYTGRNVGPARADDEGRPYFQTRPGRPRWSATGKAVFEAFRPGTVWYREVRMQASASGTCREAELAGAAALAAGKRQEAFEAYTRALQGPCAESFTERRLRESYLRLAATLPAPSVPEEARRRAGRASAFVKSADDPALYEKAAAEMKEAVRAAPWWPEAYFNLGLMLAAAKRHAEAVAALELYLLAAPEAEDAEAVRQRIYELEVAKELDARPRP